MSGSQKPERSSGILQVEVKGRVVPPPPPKPEVKEETVEKKKGKKKGAKAAAAAAAVAPAEPTAEEAAEAERSAGAAAASRGTWCHVSCAFWCPELGFVEDDIAKGIRIDELSRERLELQCVFCKQVGLGYTSVWDCGL